MARLITDKGTNIADEVTYGCPIGRNDHVIIEFRVEERGQ